MKRFESGFLKHTDVNAEDPHLQYVRVDGHRSMIGDLNMDGYNISNTTIDGYNLSEIFNITGDTSGFPNRTTSIISVNNTTREFTITPIGSYDIYINGYKITKTVAETVTFTDTEGLHFFYFNQNNVLIHTTLASEFGEAILSGVFVAGIYWDTDSNTTILLGDERHGLMDGRTHYHLHNSFGAQWYDGGALGNIIVDGTGNIATHAQFSVSNVTLADEDIVHKSSNTSQVLTFPAQIPIYYRTGADGYWRRKTPDIYPMIYNGTAGYSGTYVPYNQWTGSTWQLTSVTSGNFVLIHFFAGNDINNTVFGIQGQAQYATIADARTGASTEIASLSGTAQLLYPEFVKLGTIIIQTGNSYSNTPRARIRSTDTGDTYIDFRGASVRGSGATISDHGNLSGLLDDDHLQYLLVNGTRAMTGSLNMSNYNITNIGTVDGYNIETFVTGPSTATDNAVARFDGTTGKLIQNSAVTISDTGFIDGVHSISLNLLPEASWPAWQEGLIFYDSTNHALVVYNDQSAVTQQIGQEIFNRVVNKTGSTITNGSVVYINGAQDNRPTIALAKADNITTSIAIGVATHDILNNQEGLVTIKGVVHSLNTSSFTAGDMLYVSPTTAGAITNIRPLGDNIVWNIGVALNSTINGSILISIQGPTTLTCLHDVNGITSALDGYYLRGNGTYWEGRDFNNDVLNVFNDGYIQNLGTITFNEWPTITLIDGYAIAEFSSHQNITINLNNQSSVTIQLNEPIGSGSFVLILKQGSSVASTITWATEGTHALYSINGSISVASGTSAITLISLNYDGTDWYAVSSQPMQQVIAN